MKFNLHLRQAIFGLITFTLGLLSLPILIRFLVDKEIINPELTIISQGVVLLTVVIGFIWFVRKKVSKQNQSNRITIKKLFVNFVLGTSIILIPVIATIISCYAMGWSVSLNLTNSTLQSIMISLLGAMLFESIPEELMFRGFIFNQFQKVFTKRRAFILTVLAFTVSPLLVYMLYSMLFSTGVYVGGNLAPTPFYIFGILLFGTFLQYLRLISGTIWMGVGFHTMFLMFNKVIGMSETSLIRYSDSVQDAIIQPVFFLTGLLIIAALIIIPIKRKRLEKMAA